MVDLLRPLRTAIFGADQSDPGAAVYRERRRQDERAARRSRVNQAQARLAPPEEVREGESFQTFTERNPVPDVPSMPPVFGFQSRPREPVVPPRRTIPDVVPLPPRPDEATLRYGDLGIQAMFAEEALNRRIAGEGGMNVRAMDNVRQQHRIVYGWGAGGPRFNRIESTTLNGPDGQPLRYTNHELAEQLEGISGGPHGLIPAIDSREGATRNPNSSANGYGQFIVETWFEVLRDYGPHYGIGLADSNGRMPSIDDYNSGNPQYTRYDEILEWRFHFPTAGAMIIEYAGKNARAFEREVGRYPSIAEVRISHFSGNNEIITDRARGQLPEYPTRYYNDAERLANKPNFYHPVRNADGSRHRDARGRIVYNLNSLLTTEQHIASLVGPLSWEHVEWQPRLSGAIPGEPYRGVAPATPPSVGPSASISDPLQRTPDPEQPR